MPTHKHWPLWCSAEGVPPLPCPPSTHTEELPIPACVYLICPGGQMGQLETLIRTCLRFSMKPPRSCNSPCKPTIIEKISSYRQQAEAHKYHPCNIHSKWVHQETGCGKSKAITGIQNQRQQQANWRTNYKNNNFPALQSVLRFISRRENWKKRRKKPQKTLTGLPLSTK